MLISDIKKVNNGKTYMQVDGKPFLYNAVQSMYPACGDYSKYVKCAAEAGFTVFSFWFYWRLLESQKGEFDFSHINSIVDAANKYNIRLDIIWAGTNFCDHLDHRFAPKWLFCDSTYYLKDKNGVPYIAEGYNEACPESPAADPCNNELLQLEQRALKALFEHLSEYDTTHRVIAIQLENEINMQGYWGGKENVLSYINLLGRAVKESNYSVVTRVNTNDLEMDKDIDALEYIDGQGLDVYDENIDVIRCAMRDTRCTKFKHIAENHVPYNSTALIVTALANGGFYNIYRIDDDVKYNKAGVYDDKLQITVDTLKHKKLNSALCGMAEILAVAAPDEMLEFNTETSQHPVRNYRSLKALGEHYIGMKSEGFASVGLVVKSGEYYYCIADDRAVFFVYSRELECETGYFKDGKWVCESIVKTESEKIKWDRSVTTVRYTPCKVLRIKVTGHTNECQNYREKMRQLWNDEKRFMCGEREPWYDKCDQTETV